MTPRPIERSIPAPDLMAWFGITSLCLLLVFRLLVGSVALAQETPPTPTWLKVAEGALDVLTEGPAESNLKAFNAAAFNSWTKHADTLNRYDKLLFKLDLKYDLVEKVYGVKAFAEKLSLVLDLKTIGDDLQAGNYLAATQTAVGLALKYAAAWAGADLAGIAAGLLCGTLGPIGLAICFIAATAAVNYGVDVALGALGDAFGRFAYCRLRPQDRDCGAAFAGPPHPQITPPDIGLLGGPIRPRPNGAAGPPAQSPGGGKGRVSAGSTNINVIARDLTASASGGGKAINQVAAVDGGSANVAVDGVTTLSDGVDARTAIAPGGGNVVVQGHILTENGDTTIGGGGQVSRNGRPCIDIYRQTCIVSIYWRKHYSDPCAPGWWIYLQRCELPADLDHKLVGMGHY